MALATRPSFSQKSLRTSPSQQEPHPFRASSGGTRATDNKRLVSPPLASEALPPYGSFLRSSTLFPQEGRGKLLSIINNNLESRGPAAHFLERDGDTDRTKNYSWMRGQSALTSVRGGGAAHPSVSPGPGSTHSRLFSPLAFRPSRSSMRSRPSSPPPFLPIQTPILPEFTARPSNRASCGSVDSFPTLYALLPGLQPTDLGAWLAA